MHRTVTKRNGRIAPWLTLVLVGIVAVPVAIGVYGNVPSETGKPAKPINAWQKVEPHLDRLDQASAEVAERHLQRIRAFFDDRKRGAKTFSEWAFGWTAKYHAVVGKLQGDDGARFRQFLQEKFELTMFKADDLKAVLESAMAGALTEMRGLEGAALVQIRADLADDQLYQGNVPELQSDEVFAAEYQRVSEEVLPRLLTDLNVGVAGQITNFVGSEVAAQTLGRSLAARLGLSSGLLGSAARSGVVTFGVSLVAWFALDYVLDWILQLFGYDPAGDLRVQVETAMDRTQARLIDGDPVAVAEYQRLRQQERDESSSEARQQCREQADRIEESGDLGLRFALTKLRELQSRLRREALSRLVSTQAGQ